MMRCSVSRFFSIITIIIGISATTSGGASCSIDASCDHLGIGYLDIDRSFPIPSNNHQNSSSFRIQIMQCGIEISGIDIKNCSDLKMLCADALRECRFCFYNGGMIYVITGNIYSEESMNLLSSSTAGSHLCEVQDITSESCDRKFMQDAVQMCTTKLFSGSHGPSSSNCKLFPLFAYPYFCDTFDGHHICDAFCNNDGLHIPDKCKHLKKTFCCNNLLPLDAGSKTSHIISNLRGLHVLGCMSGVITRLVPSIFTDRVNVENMASIYMPRCKYGISTTRDRCFTRDVSMATTIESKSNLGCTQDIMVALDAILDTNFSLQWQDAEPSDVEQLLTAINDVRGKLARVLSPPNSCEYNYIGNNIVFHVGRHKLQHGKSTFRFPTDEERDSSDILGNASIEISFITSNFCKEDNDTEDCSVTIAVSILDNFAEHIHETIPFNDSHSIFEMPDSVLLSAHVSASAIDFQLAHIKLTFRPKAGGMNESLIHTGAFVDKNAEDELVWNTSGLTTEVIQDGRICITSNHLANFAILVSLTGDTHTNYAEKLTLHILSYIGCIISIISLVLTLMVSLVFRKKLNKGVILYVHMNLSLALLLALLVFVVGIEQAAFNAVLCLVVATLIQYFFLCAFCWMLAEGIMMYLLIVRVFGRWAKRWYLLLPLGWGVPIPIVAISAGLFHEDYIDVNQTFCWIDASPSKPAIWTFLGPMLIIIIINSVILVMTIYTIVKGRKLGGAECNVSNFELVKTAVKGSTILLPLLGLTWILGIFAVNSNTSVFTWLFTIINSLQGFFIFVMHTMRNEMILEKFKMLKKQFHLKKSKCHSTLTSADKVQSDSKMKSAVSCRNTE